MGLINHYAVDVPQEVAFLLPCLGRTGKMVYSLQVSNTNSRLEQLTGRHVRHSVLAYCKSKHKRRVYDPALNPLKHVHVIYCMCTTRVSKR